MKVIYVKPTSDNKRFIVGVVSDEEKLRYNISSALYLSLKISSGDEIDGETLDMFSEDNERYLCMRTALSYLAYADNNRKNLYAKLIRRGYGREMARDAVEECVRLGYINEYEQVKRAIEKEADKLYGRAYIFKKLAAKGYSAPMLNSAFDELIQDGEIDFSANLQTLIYKKGCESEDDRKKLMHKYGYLTRDTYDD